jgi:hypothetical protein
MRRDESASEHENGSGRVVPFDSRTRLPGSSRERSSRNSAEPLVKDVGKYARDPQEDDDDYRHRMITNAIAFAVLVVLIVCGIWLADTMAQMRRDQDCVLSGRRNCTPLEIPDGDRR